MPDFYLLNNALKNILSVCFAYTHNKKMLFIAIYCLKNKKCLFDAKQHKFLYNQHLEMAFSMLGTIYHVPDRSYSLLWDLCITCTTCQMGLTAAMQTRWMEI